MIEDSFISRKDFLVSALTSTVGLGLPFRATGVQIDEITIADLKSYAKIAGLQFTDEELTSVLASVKQAIAGYEAIRKLPIDNAVAPPTPFLPTPITQLAAKVQCAPSRVTSTKLPSGEDDIAFSSVRELAHFIKTKQISPVELTDLYLRRLQRYGMPLLCVINLTEERARREAKIATEEISSGNYRGPLHGIPYGIKDLFAARGAPTTWGAEIYQQQLFDYDAAVVERLSRAGAILVAKLSLGTFAQGDVWFKGRTKNPWNSAQGSSGSSAGSACATAAGLVPLGIGTETSGSIVSPSHQCRVIGLRPTFGRVSRFGGMTLSWTMDKVGVLARHSEDAAIVLAAICGADERDQATIERPFVWQPNLDITKLKVGYLIGQNDDVNDRSRIERDDYLKALAKLGVNLSPLKFTPIPNGAYSVLTIESSAAFDALTRSADLNLVKNSAWPQSFRANRFVPAVEYIQAMRARRMVMDTFSKEMATFDAIIAQDRGGFLLLNTNLTGHPQLLVPNGVDGNGAPRSVSIIGRLYGEATILALGKRLQQELGHYKNRPDLSSL